MRHRQQSTSSDESEADKGKSKTVCYLCRQRKTKCDRTLPSCGFCIKAKVECQYVPKPGKRGLRAGYVTQLGERLDHVETELNHLKRQTASTAASIHVPTPQSVEAAQSATVIAETPWSEPPSKRQRQRPESDAAVKDLMSLGTPMLYSMAETWFKENQPWSPILSYDHIMDALASLPDPVDSIDDVELRAVLALELSYSSQTLCLGYHGRARLSQWLRGDVLTEAMSRPSLSSLKALLIIALMDYGSDNIPSTFSLMSVCRRTCEHLGLFEKLRSQIDGESPAQIGPPPTDSSGDAHTISVTWGILALDAVSTLGVSWRDVSAALVNHLSSVAYVSHPYFRDSYRGHVHLAAIGLQPVHEFFHERSQTLLQPVDDALLERCDEMYQNLIFYVDSQPKTSYTILENGVVDFDPNLCHTEALVYGAIIMLYQGLVDFERSSPAIALERCLRMCNEHMMTLVRSISDADAELNTPLLSSFLFIAARFKLVYCRQRRESLDVPFDILMHGLNMCARRWLVARRYDIVLRAAAAEVCDNRQGTSLPANFWDLKKSHLDISEEMKAWVSTWKTSLHESSLGGPYHELFGK